MAAKKSKDIPAAVGRVYRGSTGSLPGVYTCGYSPAWVCARSGMCFFPAECCQGDLMTLLRLHYTLYMTCSSVLPSWESQCGEGPADGLVELRATSRSWGRPQPRKPTVSKKPGAWRQLSRSPPVSGLCDLRGGGWLWKHILPSRDPTWEHSLVDCLTAVLRETTGRVAS